MFSAEKIKQIRKKLMMTQQEFADALNVGVNSVIRWEQGKFTPAFRSQKKLFKFCEQNNINLEN